MRKARSERRCGKEKRDWAICILAPERCGKSIIDRAKRWKIISMDVECRRYICNFRSLYLSLSTLLSLANRDCDLEYNGLFEQMNSLRFIIKTIQLTIFHLRDVILCYTLIEILFYFD